MGQAGSDSACLPQSATSSALRLNMLATVCEASETRAVLQPQQSALSGLMTKQAVLAHSSKLVVCFGSQRRHALQGRQAVSAVDLYL